MEMNQNNIEQLPFKRESNKKWSFFYAYNLRTVRDIFLYVAWNRPSEQGLYDAMENYEIKAPRDKWANENTKDKNRLKLEYLHGTKYLGLIKLTENGLFEIDLSDFSKEKEEILACNQHRDIKAEKETPKLSNQEIKAFIPIILNYTRAKEYLWWFLDFNKFPTVESFTINDFKANGKSIYLQKGKDQKGSEIIYRLIDGRFWKTPFEEHLINNEVKRTNDYTRLVSYVFPSWYEELGLIDRIPILKEFGFIEGNWELHYPLSRKTIELEIFENFLIKKFNNRQRSINVIWIPLIIYETVLQFQISIDEIKRLLISLYEERSPKFIMERSSLQVMRYSRNIRNRDRHLELFLTYRGFTRNNFIINNQ